MSVVPIRWKAYDEKPDVSTPWWSGDKDPPKIGTQVVLTLNGWEGIEGTVDQFAIDGNWLGVWVMIQDVPDWVEPTGNGKLHFFFGRDLSY